jgi:long-chain fatty acid transport protein
MKQRSVFIITLMALFPGVVPSSFAGGYRLSLQGQKALGMGHAGAALTDSAEVVFFNPAGMAFLQSDLDITGGVTPIQSNTLFQNQITQASSETDNPLGTPFNIYLTQKSNAQISYGLGIYTPFGNSVEWEKNWPGSHLLNTIELQTIVIQPTISYQLNDTFSVGLGASYVTGDVEFNRDLSTSLTDTNGIRSSVTIEASNVDAWGYNIGIFARLSPKISLGIDYRSKIELRASNESADFKNIPSSLQADFPDTTFSADLILPAELALAMAYHFNEQTLVAFDFNRTFWSAYKDLNVQFNNGAGTSLNPRNYEDSNIYRFGAQHQVEKFVFRAGVYLDKTPVKQGYFTPETPRNDSIGITSGASYSLSEKWTVDISYLFLIFDEFEGRYDFYQQSGTNIPFSGEYKNSAVAFGFGAQYKI